MTRFPKLFSFIIMLIMIAGLIGPVGLVSGQALAKAHPGLIQLAAEQPDQLVAVIVQKLAKDSHPEELVAQLGGTVTRNLSIINAFAAKMEAKDVLALAVDPGVRWVSLDAPMEHSTVSSSASVYDSFSTWSFSGNDGTTSWSAPWQELNEWDGPTRGFVEISSSNYCPSGYCLEIGDRYGGFLFLVGLSRQTDLRRASEATLSFSYRRKINSFYSSGSIYLQVSGDGGTSWATLAQYHINTSDKSQTNQEFDISAFIAPNTQIRFLANGYIDGYFYADNIKITFNDWQNQFLDTTGVTQSRAQGLTGQGIGVAVIDSGIANHADLSSHLLQPADFPGGDTYGHGTHVTGIIAGNGQASGGLYQGVAPGAHVINLNITDAYGMAYESDVIEALQWVYDNRSTYNIRVVNMSLNSTLESSYHQSPLDAASEILWFNGIVVVASVGNKGPAGGYNTAKTSPANDPFLIVVGASDEHGTTSMADDTYAPFASFGITQDGFSRPDIVAPGFNIVAALSSESSWRANYPYRVVGGEYIRLSGTSMAAPVVAGAVALLLQDEPNLTPDQVKYRLMNSGNAILQEGVAYPYLNVYAAVNATTTESANTGLVASQLLWTGDDPVTWGSVAWNSVAWNSVAWNSVAWNSVAWNSVAWNSAIELDGIFWGPGEGNGHGKVNK